MSRGLLRSDTPIHCKNKPRWFSINENMRTCYGWEYLHVGTGNHSIHLNGEIPFLCRRTENYKNLLLCPFWENLRQITATYYSVQSYVNYWCNKVTTVMPTCLPLCNSSTRFFTVGILIFAGPPYHNGNLSEEVHTDLTACQETKKLWSPPQGRLFCDIWTDETGRR